MSGFSFGFWFPIGLLCGAVTLYGLAMVVYLLFLVIDELIDATKRWF